MTIAYLIDAITFLGKVFLISELLTHQWSTIFSSGGVVMCIIYVPR